MLERITDVTDEPVPLAEAIEHASLGVDETAKYEHLLTAAREFVESATGLSIGEQRWRLTLGSASALVALPRPPVASIESVTIGGEAFAGYTLAGDNLRLDGALPSGGLIIEYSAGTPVSARARLAVLQAFTHYASYPFPATDAPPKAVPFSLARILRSLRDYSDWGAA